MKNDLFELTASRRSIRKYDGEPIDDEILDEITKEWGVGCLCNQVYSGTEVIKDFGEEEFLKLVNEEVK